MRYDDACIKTEYLAYPRHKARERCADFRAATKPPGKLPGVVVVHEDRGLNPYIEDAARRLVVGNFMAASLDALTSLGGYPGDEERAVQLLRQLDATRRSTICGPERPPGVSAAARPRRVRAGPGRCIRNIDICARRAAALY